MNARRRNDFVDEPPRPTGCLPSIPSEIQVVLIGDSCVGKTCIVYRLIQNFIPDIVRGTLSAYTCIHTISVSGKNIKLNIWDTGGDLRNIALMQAIFRTAGIVMIVYDVSIRSTFEDASEFYRLLIPTLSENIELALVGNMCDLGPSQRKVSYEEGLNMATRIGAHYYEVSATSSIGVTDLFTFSCYHYIRRLGIYIPEPQRVDSHPPELETTPSHQEASNQPPQESEQPPQEPSLQLHELNQPAEPPEIKFKKLSIINSPPPLTVSTKLQCIIVSTKSLTNNKIDCIEGPHISLIFCACSTSHFLILDSHNICYGLGDNRNHQIDSLLPSNVTTFSQITTPSYISIREVCACKTFSSFILDDGQLLIHGKTFEVEDKTIFSNFLVPRGMSSYGNAFTFAYKTGKIIFWNDKIRNSYKIKNYNIINTKINSKSIIALTGDGKLFICNYKVENSQFQQIDFNFPILSIFSSSEIFHFSTFDHHIYSLQDINNYKLLPLPINSGTINIEQKNDLIIQLDKYGKLYSNIKFDNVLTKIEFPISCFHLFSTYLIMFKGTPIHSRNTISTKYHCCSSNGLTIHNNNKTEKLFAFDSKYGYFNNGYKPFIYVKQLFNSLNNTIFTKDNKQIYMTQNNRLLCFDSNFQESFKYNLIEGDIVKTPTGVTCKCIGFNEGNLWLQPKGCKYIYTYQQPLNLYLIERHNHQLYKTIVDNIPSIIDITPTFCESFGYFIDDLIFFPKKGIVKFVGMYRNRYVFMDFSNNSLFSADIEHFEIIRSFKNKNIKRKIITDKYEIIEINVYGKNKIFLPGDRVSSKFGEGIFLGTDENDNSYIQTDIMKISGIGATKCEISNLKLIRRIGVDSFKNIKIKNDKNIKVSISTDSFGSHYKAADIINENGIRAQVIGVSMDGIAYAKDLNEIDKIFEVSQIAELIYRPDLLSGESNEVVEVGSPAYEMCVLCPDDVVEIGDKNEKFVFKGISKSGPLFVSLKSGLEVTTSYSFLLLHEAFKVLERYVIK